MRRGLRRPNMESPLYQRWFPGQGQRGGSGMYGIGDELSDAESGIFTTQSADPFPVDPSTLYPDPGYNIVPTVDPITGETMTFGTAADCADLSLWSSPQARNAACYPTVGTGANTTPGAELTPEELQAEQTAAQAWILQNVPALATAGAKTGLALTAAQLASGLAVGSVVKSAACPGGYSFSTGVCVPPMAGSKPPGQWVSFATNQQLLTWGGLVIAALVIVNLIPSGGGRRRR